MFLRLLDQHLRLDRTTNQKPPRNAFAFAAICAGLAIATKGVPGLLLTAYSLFFFRWNPWIRVPYKSLCSWQTTSCCIAGSWYLAMWMIHGDLALRMFLDDQVHKRIVTFWWRHHSCNSPVRC